MDPGDHIMSFGTAYQLEQDNTANPSFGTDTTYTFSAAATQDSMLRGFAGQHRSGLRRLYAGAVGSGS